jgi:SAM-dependent methyltransferase
MQLMWNRMNSATKDSHFPTSRLMRAFINQQIRLSRWFDRLLPADCLTDGCYDFTQNIVPRYLKEDCTVYDVGSGSNPLIDHITKARWNLNITGLDIEDEQLAAAPQESYDRTICADIVEYRGDGDADLVICRCVLEHVSDVAKALSGIRSIMRSGAKALVFVPCRNAWFARINLMLPETLRHKILYGLYPKTAGGHAGFPPVYNNCTPKLFRRMACESGLVVRESKMYFTSEYFSFFLPLYIAWRLWVLTFRFIAGEHAAETFAMVLVKPLAEESVKPRATAEAKHESHSNARQMRGPEGALMAAV